MQKTFQFIILRKNVAILRFLCYDKTMNQVITAFKEHKTFKQNRPWDVNTLTFPTDTVTPPHYADTIEVLLCCNVMGEIYIGGQKNVLGGNQVFYIPPRAVHSIFYKKNNGYVKVLKIHVEQFKAMLNIETLLQYSGKSFLCLPLQIPCFEEVCNVADVFHSSDNIFEICQCVLRLFGLLVHYCETSDFEGVKNDINNHNLRKIILWTENNYLKKISIAEIAQIVGYEKHYFCNKFKSLTGISYISYVNALRIQHACRLLAGGSPVSAVCDACGFENLSYFIQLFKKTVGTTPKIYAANVSTQKSPVNLFL